MCSTAGQNILVKSISHKALRDKLHLLTPINLSHSTHADEDALTLSHTYTQISTALYVSSGKLALWACVRVCISWGERLNDKPLRFISEFTAANQTLTLTHTESQKGGLCRSSAIVSPLLFITQMSLTPIQIIECIMNMIIVLQKPCYITKITTSDMFLLLLLFCFKMLFQEMILGRHEQEVL